MLNANTSLSDFFQECNPLKMKPLVPKDTSFFVSREFTTSTLDGDFDFFIHTQSRFMLYINATPCFSGPIFAQNGFPFTIHIPISEIVKLGKNIIDIQFFPDNSDTELLCVLSHADKPIIKSDSTWRCRSNAIQPIYQREELSTYRQTSLNGTDFPILVTNLTHQIFTFFSTHAFSANKQTPNQSLTQGTIRAGSNCASFHFADFTPRLALYELRNSITCHSNILCDVVISNNIPFLIFTDDKLIFSNARYDEDSNRTFITEEGDQTSFLMHLSEGKTNLRILLMLECADSRLLSISFSEKFDEASDWRFSSPLRFSFPDAAHSTSLKPSLIHTNIIEKSPLDIGQQFSLSAPTVQQTPARDKATRLEEGQFATFSSKTFFNGYPRAIISATPGDIIDIFYLNEKTSPEDIQMALHTKVPVDSIIYGHNKAWYSCSIRKAHAILVYARKAHQSITINSFSFINHHKVNRPVSFACNDKKLTSIFKTSFVTQENAYQFRYLDSPYGDQKQYLYDAAFAARLDLEIADAAHLSKTGLLDFAINQYDNGQLPAVTPSVDITIPDYSLRWIIWLDYHLFIKTDPELSALTLPVLEKLLNYFDTHSKQTHGILGSNFAEDTFIDHQIKKSPGYNTALNALYCKALFSSATIFRIHGNLELADKFHAKGLHVATVLHKYAWDEIRGLFRNSFSSEETINDFCLVTNITVLNSGIANETRFNRIFNECFLLEEPFFRLPVGDKLNPAFVSIIIEVAILNDKRHWALNLMRWYWGSIIDEDLKTWPEFHNPLRKNHKPCLESRQCFPSGSLPALFLTNLIAGISRDRYDNKLFYFSPLIDEVNSANGQISTENGTLSVQWHLNKKNQLHISFTSNDQVSVYILLDQDAIDSSTIEVEGDIQIQYPS